MSNLHPVGVLGRCGETQLQVGENLNCISYVYFALVGCGFENALSTYITCLIMVMYG